ncbi:hypothetical protein [Streptomyces silvisoli]|uniref:Transposase n=1 Tax=Streptomyces silvisoli TaxID=3034235 RepID=A0ABT5ZK20_9ACTN|nr:hypothetical protein [Streptomyces silvisoli]MDF3290172.1 hypothetical protein [Streptomyces silvisoli]
MLGAKRHSDSAAWTAGDALHAKASLVGWLRTKSAARALYNTFTADDEHSLVPWGEMPLDERQLRLHEHLADRTVPDSEPEDPGPKLQLSSAAVRDCELVYADLAMGNMVAAAVQSIPAIELRPHHFLSPFGMVIFSKPFPEVRVDPAPDMLVRGRSRFQPCAYIWEVGESAVIVTEWERRFGPHTLGHLGDAFYEGLAPASVTVGRFGDKDWSLDWHRQNPLAVLLSLTALSRQPLAHIDVPKVPQQVAGRARRAGVDVQRFRRIRLRQPERAALELQAARDKANGTTRAGHWVRGHWRQQYYPSIDEHQAVWIEGHPRGDFTKPASNAPRILIANGDRNTKRRVSSPVPC